MRSFRSTCDQLKGSVMYRHTIQLLSALSIVLVGCATSPNPSLRTDASTATQDVAAATTANKPEKQPFLTTEAAPSPAPGITAFVVPALVSEPAVEYVVTQAPPNQGIRVFEQPVPGIGGRGVGVFYPGDATGGDRAAAPAATTPEPQSTTPALVTSFDSTDFDDNGTPTGGFRFIPPDSHAATGPDHVVTVVNVSMRFHTKTGTEVYGDGLKQFFTGLTPATFTFDPKVLYDQYNGRFVVVTLEQTDVAAGGASNTSKIFVAVSDDDDPTGTWYQTSINSKLSISGSDRWADYPGLGVDEEAIYVTANMFGFGGGGFGGARLWTIAKGAGSGGFYDGGAATVSVLDPYTPVGSVATTTQPAHVFGTAPAGTGTYLVSYSGLSDGVNEFLQWVRIDTPLGTPTLTQGFIDLGDLEGNTAISLPDAPQSGSATAIEVNDRRALDADWRADTSDLWVVFTINPGSGANANQTTAAWYRVDTTTLGTPTIGDSGQIGGEDIAANTYTFFPAVAVNDDGAAIIGFSASASTIFAGAYFATRVSSDPPGSLGGSEVLKAGTDFYVRKFGGSRNRWGDYSGAAVDPADQCLWVFNEYAITRGTIISGEDGRWATTAGKVCPVVFIDGFESGNTSAWSTVVP